MKRTRGSSSAVFTQVLDALAEQGPHLRASATVPTAAPVARYPEMYLDMVRPGIALYGVGDDAGAAGPASR